MTVAVPAERSNSVTASAVILPWEGAVCLANFWRAAGMSASRASWNGPVATRSQCARSSSARLGSMLLSSVMCWTAARVSSSRAAACSLSAPRPAWKSDQSDVQRKTVATAIST